MDDSLVYRPDSHPHSTKCSINPVVSPDDGHIVARNMQIHKYTKNKLCAKLALGARGGAVG